MIAPRFAEANRDKAYVIFGVLLQNQLIGVVRIGNKPDADPESEAAFFIAVKKHGNGYTDEAVFAVSRWTSEPFTLRPPITITKSGTTPSQRVMETCGFQRIESHTILHPGETEKTPFD